MKHLRALNRREFLGVIGRGTVALVAELSVSRSIFALALGGSSLAACASPAVPPATATLGATLAPMATQNSTNTPAAATQLPANTPTTAPATTMPTSDLLTYLPLAVGVSNAYVLVRGEEVALVDTGVAGNAEKFSAALETMSLTWANVQHIILTHHHRDHVGSLGEILALAEKATVYAGTEDIALIQSARTITAVADQSEVFGLQMIGTPGHTPGHMCVYDPLGSALITGDALNNLNGQLSGPNPSFSRNMEQAIESARKLAGLSYERAYFGHGTPIESGASQAVAKLFPPLP
ncbi:MAG: MBL fold metallo-hydrolase [Anaerolineales bacterium]|nr:MBL fold metallo-hydrolase [Anaerolineales bacterium]